MDDGEAAFAAHPPAVPGQDAGVVEDGGFVQEHAAAVDGARKGHLVRVEVLEA